MMNLWHDAFSRHDLHVAQMLLTRGDFEDRGRYLNIRNCIAELHNLNAIPIVNENDTVAVDEIRFGDNDILAALVTNAIPADALVLLSVVDGLHDSDGQVVDLVEDPLAMRMLVTGEKSALGSGGMETKLEAARRVTDAGEIAVIANGRTPDVLTKLTAGERVGTVFVPAHRKLASRERWIGMAVRPGGVLVVDEGAANALRVRGKSLLATGITEITGNFDKGEVVIIRDQRGREVGRGLINYAAEEVRTIQGRRSSEFEKLLGRRAYDEVVHRDNLVVSGRRDEAGDEKDAPR
jgi:glutamate 5-kinase